MNKSDFNCCRRMLEWNSRLGRPVSLTFWGPPVRMGVPILNMIYGDLGSPFLGVPILI